MSILSQEELRSRLRTTISRSAPYAASMVQKRENIEHFNALDREGLQYGVREKRLLLYRTRCGEQIFIQFPGLETTRGEKRYPLDLRPVLMKRDGTYCPDMDFKQIWDVIDAIGVARKGDLDILATLFLRIAYMIDHRRELEMPCPYETIDLIHGSTAEYGVMPFTWNALYLDPDVLETLNDQFAFFGDISLEGFLYYNDLLAQNEDCKYFYRQNQQGKKWDPKVGRINNCLSHLTIISHLQGHIGISKLIDSFQRTGVAPLPQNQFSKVCGALVERV